MFRLLRTNAFRLAALYMVLFAASVLTLLAFIYFSTANFVERQTEETIGAEITGLHEQYREHGLLGLIEAINSRTPHPNATSRRSICSPTRGFIASRAIYPAGRRRADQRQPAGCAFRWR